MRYILDSGAFSAWTKGATIDIDEYCEFCRKHEDFIDHYIVLDVIGCAEKSLENQKYMEMRGLKPLPVFHQGDDWSYLEHYIKNYEYVCISPLSYSAGGGSMATWLDKVFSEHVCGKDGYPKVKTHGLGLTTVNMLIRYPWYSVDSASGILQAAFGSINIPKMKNGKWDFSVSPLSVDVSDDPRAQSKATHYINLSTAQKAVVNKWLAELDVEFGITDKDTKEVIKEGVDNSHTIRMVCNILYYLRLESVFDKYPRRLELNTTKGLFG